jgi:hypothetical protein
LNVENVFRLLFYMLSVGKHGKLITIEINSRDFWKWSAPQLLIGFRVKKVLVGQNKKVAGKYNKRRVQSRP